jgi:Bax protein
MAHFDAWGYDLASARAGLPVPRLFLARLPADWPSAPASDSHKRLFLTAVLPLVLRANERIRRERASLRAIRARARHGIVPDLVERNWLADLAGRHGGSAGDLDALMSRVDVVPPSLALAQAALESGWGSSRFSRAGNALFGQWTYGKGSGMVPARRAPGARHEVRAFETLAGSIEAYMSNLNRHPAYDGLRRTRAELRRAGAVDGLALAAGLAAYSARGETYIEELRRLIRVNDLAALDSARLRAVPWRLRRYLARPLIPAARPETLRRSRIGGRSET